MTDEIWRSQRATRGSTLPHGFMTGAVFVGTGIPPGAAGKGITGDLFDS